MNAVMTESGFAALVEDKGLTDENGTDCCCGDGRLFYILNLCHTSHNAPPEVPRCIAVEVPFECGGCPLSSGRIVIYRGYCYAASINHMNPCPPLPCAGGVCESPKFNRNDVGNCPIVNAGELQCKPLDVTCATVPCVPEEPGCCSATDRMDCPDGSFAVCNRPKRFRVLRFGTYNIKSWCTESPQQCETWRVYEDIKIKWNVWHEFACVENGGTFTEATCRAGGGSITVSGYLPPFDHLNGEWVTGPIDGQLGGLFGGVSGYDAYVSKGEMRQTINSLRDPLGFRPCGFHFPSGDDETRTETRNCNAGRFFNRLRVTASTGAGTPGTYDETEYADCNFYMKKIDTVGFDAPFRCPGQIRWDDKLRDEIHLVFVTACPDQPPPPPIPEYVRRLMQEIDIGGYTGSGYSGDIL